MKPQSGQMLLEMSAVMKVSFLILKIVEFRESVSDGSKRCSVDD
jgi:hypothetical protein